MIFLQKNYLAFFLQGLQRTNFTFFGIFLWKSFFTYVMLKFDGKKMPEIDINLNMLRYSNSYFFNSTCIFLPSTCPSTDFKLFTWGLLFFSKYYDICFLRWSWNADWPKVAKVLSVWTSTGFAAYPSVKVQLWIPLWRSVLTFHFQMILCLNHFIFWFL